MTRIEVPIRVARPGGLRCDDIPVTGGVPLPKAALRPEDDLQLVTAEGRSAPLQWEILERWGDGTARWILLDFRGDAPGQYVLTRGRGPSPGQRVRAFRREDTVTMDTGAVRICFRETRFRLFDAVTIGSHTVAGPGDLLLVGDRGGRYTASAGLASARIERRGPMRATVEVRGGFANRRGRHCMSYLVRIHAYAGADAVRVEYVLLNDNDVGVFTKIREASVLLDLPGGIRRASVGVDGFVAGRPPLDVFQRDHGTAIVTREGASIHHAGHLRGWLRATHDEGALTVALRDAWQQWPKRIGAARSGVEIGLFPRLQEDEYDGLEPREKLYYLFDGPKYMIKTGVAKRHEFWLRFSMGKKDDGDELAERANAPAYATASPSSGIGSGAWGDLAPAAAATAQYDRLAAGHRAAFAESLETDEQTGVLNWGDWFGERKYNWGNGEYDTAHTAFLDFARTGDPDAALLGERAARHMADVDVLHALNDDYLHSGEIRANHPHGVFEGAMYLHAIGHVGGYFPLRWAKKHYPGAYSAADPRNLGHVWTEGLVDLWRLTGDAWALEAARKVADNLVQIANTPGFTFWFGRDPHCGRVAGWPLTALMAVYAATGDRRYFRAARRIVDLALKDQDPHCGGWVYPLYPGHCYCRTVHVGMATFITAVLLNGLVSYHLLTEDERVGEAIVRGVDFVLSDTWVEHLGHFRYTSCPASKPRPGHLILRPLAYACRLAPSERRRAVMVRAWKEFLHELERPGVMGKSYGAMHREAPRVLAHMERAEG